MAEEVPLVEQGGESQPAAAAVAPPPAPAPPSPPQLGKRKQAGDEQALAISGRVKRAQLSPAAPSPRTVVHGAAEQHSYAGGPPVDMSDLTATLEHANKVGPMHSTLC